jgi:recombination protein RecT
MSDQGQQTAITRKQETPASRLNMYLQQRAKNLAQYARNSVRPDTMIRLAVFEFANNEWLQKCQPETVYASLITAAQLGLEPSGVRGEAYLVPFKGKCTLIPGWRGLIKLALRSKAVKSIYSHVVLSGDDFVVQLGTDIKIHHVPLMNAGDEVREVIAAYAVAVLENGQLDVEVMDRFELDRVRDFAASGRGGKDGPAYQQWADQMYRKAPIRRLCKRLPLGDDYFLAAKLDELHDQGKPDEIGNFIDVPSEDAPAEPGASRIQAAVDRTK